MPKWPSKDWHEPYLKALTKTRNVDMAAASLGIKRDTVCRHYKTGTAFAARWDDALEWQTAFLKSRPPGTGRIVATPGR